MLGAIMALWRIWSIMTPFYVQANGGWIMSWHSLQFFWCYIMIRCQSNLLRKMSLQQDKLVLSEKWWICKKYSAFTNCSISIHSFPWYFNYITPLWSAANYYQEFSVRWKAWNISKIWMQLIEQNEEANMIDRCRCIQSCDTLLVSSKLLQTVFDETKGQEVSKWSDVNQTYLAKWYWKKDFLCSHWGVVDASIVIHFYWLSNLDTFISGILQLHNTPLVSC